MCTFRFVLYAGEGAVEDIVVIQPQTRRGLVAEIPPRGSEAVGGRLDARGEVARFIALAASVRFSVGVLG